ncbi:MAG: hypothetical protein WA903_06620 [Ornithinimicrobium sp.]
MPSPAPAVQALGGIATFAELRSTVSRREIERALARDEISKDRRGRYVLASTPQHLRVAHELSAVLSHESAALHYGWKVKSAPELPVVTVRHSRRLSAQDRTRCSAHYSNLPASYVHQGVTTPTRTVLDCARLLPFDRALVVADSALRAGDVARDRLRTDAAQLRGRGAARARAVAHEASYVSANPLESVLRAIALGVSGYSFVPQLRIWDHGLYATVDLGDRGLKVALEAEGIRLPRWAEGIPARLPTVRRTDGLGVDGLPLRVGARHARSGLRRLDPGFVAADSPWSRGRSASGPDPSARVTIPSFEPANTPVSASLAGSSALRR